MVGFNAGAFNGVMDEMEKRNPNLWMLNVKPNIDTMYDKRYLILKNKNWKKDHFIAK